jgi:hypothetical protein
MSEQAGATAARRAQIFTFLKPRASKMDVYPDPSTTRGKRPGKISAVNMMYAAKTANISRNNATRKADLAEGESFYPAPPVGAEQTQTPLPLRILRGNF